MTAITITTFGDLLTDMAEKLGETTQATSNDRKRKLNSAYYFITNQRLWWFLESESTDTTTTALSYTLPSDFRVFRPKNPVKIGSDWRVLVPQEDQQLYDGSLPSATVQLPQVSGKKRAYLYGNKIYFIQDSMAASQTITYYYYKKITALDETSDTPLIPVEFREMISLFAAGMYLKAQGGEESGEGDSYLELYDVFLKSMQEEDDSRRKHGIKRRALDPEEAQVFNQ